MSAWIRRWLLAGIAGLWFGTPVLAAPDGMLAWTPDVAGARGSFERETGRPLREGFRVEPTIFPRYYALRSTTPGRPGVYFRDDMKWTANVRSAGWSTSDSAQAGPDGLARWQREQLQALPLDILVKVKRRSPFVAVVWSAPDCPYCRQLERSLDEAGASVYVAPVGLGEAGFRKAADAYCAVDPAARWRALMGSGGEPTAAGVRRAGCTYPRDAMIDIGFFLGRGRLATPIVVFADGSSITGWDDRQGPERLRQVLAQKRFLPQR